jgi:hypothetical protein
VGTRKTNTSTETKVKTPARCSICGEVPQLSCDWNQGRCPHLPSLLDTIMSSQYKTRFLNLFKFFTGRK